MSIDAKIARIWTTWDNGTRTVAGMTTPGPVVNLELEGRIPGEKPGQRILTVLNPHTLDPLKWLGMIDPQLGKPGLDLIPSRALSFPGLTCANDSQFQPAPGRGTGRNNILARDLWIVNRGIFGFSRFPDQRPSLVKRDSKVFNNPPELIL